MLTIITRLINYTMLHTGTITKIDAHRSLYEITTTSEESVMLFFEELRGRKFGLGDVLNFEIVFTEKFGLCALNPTKIGNQFLETINKYFETKNTMQAYVYSKSKGGYDVMYKGYRCFLPKSKSTYKRFPMNADMLLGTHQNFRVIEVKENKVILSLREDLKMQFKQLQLEEVNNIEEGFEYEGEVVNVRGYGLFVNYKYSQGFLHISKIIEKYDNLMSNLQKNEITKQMKEIYANNEKLLVRVIDVSEERYSLDWDKDVEPNKTMCQKMRKVGLKV